MRGQGAGLGIRVRFRVWCLGYMDMCFLLYLLVRTYINHIHVQICVRVYVSMHTVLYLCT